ncbi:diadenylate cyclase [Thermodesulfobacteriota bacterium]
MDIINSLVLFKKMLNWRTILDILLIAAGLFFLYRTLIRMGTWKIVAGILVAMAAFLVARFLNLTGIEWIYNNVSQVAVIALIIIFQPELRKILEKTVSVRRTRIIDVGGKVSLMVADALFTMAEQHRGAIVIFPGKEPIREWLSGGHVLDAEPSLPLITSIFDPHSPGHDGALIIESGRFSLFGVRLPLSQSSRLGEEYGTRHHAAMGLAEKSDAMAIVVSEERGKILIFRKGKILQANDRETIINNITSHWKDIASYPIEMPRGNRRWTAVSQLAASLLVAVFFWSTLIVAQGEMLEKVVTVPVEYTVPSSNLVLIGDKANEVQLHLAGQKSNLDSVSPAQLSVKIDLSKAMPGEQSVVITGENIRLPKGVNLLDVVPSSVELTLAAIIEQEVKIKPQLVGKLPGGLKIRSITVNPESVKVLSPAAESKGKNLSVTTTPIYLDSINDDTGLYCKVIAPPSIQPLAKHWPDVEVIITVER